MSDNNAGMNAIVAVIAIIAIAVVGYFAVVMLRGQGDGGGNGTGIEVDLTNPTGGGGQ